MATFTVQIYSPRWGHNDAYTIGFERDTMTIRMGMRGASCLWVDGRDPKWQGESLEVILSNDHVYGPSNLSSLLEYLWTSWRNNEITDAEAEKELNEIVAWINAITAAKPNTPFWNVYF